MTVLDRPIADRAFVFLLQFATREGTETLRKMLIKSEADILVEVKMPAATTLAILEHPKKEVLKLVETIKGSYPDYKQQADEAIAYLQSQQ